MGLGEPDRSLRLSVQVDRTACAPGATLVATIAVLNDGADPVTLSFPSAQRYELALRDASGAQRWRWSADRTFAMMLAEETLPAGELLTWHERVPMPAETGRYELTATLCTIDRRRTAEVAIDVGD